MKKYITKFDNHTQYEEATLDYPNVSYCVQENELHYSPKAPPYSGLCRLELVDGTIVDIEGSGVLSNSQLSGYASTMVSAEVGEGCTIIDYRPFYNCSGLTSIVIPNSVTGIGILAFYGCSSLTSIVIPDSVTSIGIYAFEGCTSLKNCTIGNGVRGISYQAFVNCTSLTSIVIPSGVISIGDYAFDGCTSLTSCTFGENSQLTSIGTSAFGSCGLTSINIPSGVTSIGERAFYNCRSLTSVLVEATTPPTLGTNAFNNTNDCPIYVPSASLETYKTNWSTLADRIFPIQ